MRKHLLSVTATLVMIVLALGSTTSDTSSSPGNASDRQSSVSANSDGSEVERVFAELSEDYERSMTEWNAMRKSLQEAEIEKAAIQVKLDDLGARKPVLETFEEREWSTTDKKYKTYAVLLDTDSVTVRLKKQDGKGVTVAKAMLDDSSKIYVEGAFKKLNDFRNGRIEWETKRKVLSDKLTSIDERISGFSRPMPIKPTLERVPGEIALREARKGEEERLAKEAAQEAEVARQKRNIEEFVNRLSAAGVDRSIIDSVNCSGDTVRITVANSWHVSAYQIRLQAAQNLYRIWASIAAPKDPDRARIRIEDYNGNEVGGSRFLAGSLIWVQEN